LYVNPAATPALALRSSAAQVLLAFVFDIVLAAVFLFVGLGSPISLPDFHGIERSGNMPATNQGVLKALG